MTKSDGRKWVRVVLLLCAATASGATARVTIKTLVTFDGTDGANPYDTLVQGIDGNFYGTTEDGGTYDSCDPPYGCGTVFKITPTGKLTTLLNFCPQMGCGDGSYPAAGLVPAADGNFYGTTENGGSVNGGTVFKITPGGKLTTLHRFGMGQGGFPTSTLVQSIDGSFYGTTEYGGAHDDGTVFKINPADKFATLYNFCSRTNCPDGSFPYAGLIQATDGNFYGTTFGGGTKSDGTVFRVTPEGRLSTLYTFCAQTNCADGSNPQGGLIQAQNGDFYGTTSFGGSDDVGTVFKITAKGKLTTLYSFAGYPDGAYPSPALIQATDGSFYGTTEGGGSGGPCPYVYEGGCGTIFKITPAGDLTTLYSFCPGGDCATGYTPIGGLVQATDGKFYGTTSSDPDLQVGTVFRLSAGLGPFVEERPAFGRAGAKVVILGNNLTGTTSVTFHGVAATFTVVSNSEVDATVPTGAMTSTVEVKTPKKTLKSNVKFCVAP